MVRPLAVTLLLTLAACGSVQAPPPTSLARKGEPLEVEVGGRMVDNTSTVVSISPVTKVSRVDGLHAEIVYLGLTGVGPSGKSIVRVRYEEHKIANGVEAERPDYRAEVTLDLAQGRAIDFKGWQIGVLEATDRFIRYEVVGSPAPR